MNGNGVINIVISYPSITNYRTVKNIMTKEY